MTSELELTPIKPYLLRAWYDWLCDNQLTPLLLVQTKHKDLQIPADIIGDGDSMVLNVSPQAVRDLVFDNDVVSFSTRFSGRAFAVSVPIEAVVAIVARDAEPGFFFDHEHLFDTDDDEPSERDNTGDKPNLTLVE